MHAHHLDSLLLILVVLVVVALAFRRGGAAAILALCLIGLVHCGGTPPPEGRVCPAGQLPCGDSCMLENDTCCQTYRCPAGDVCEGINDAGQGLCGGGA